MRKGRLWLLGAWLCGAGPLMAQAPPAADRAPPQAPAAPGAAPADTPADKPGAEAKPEGSKAEGQKADGSKADASKTEAPKVDTAKAPECVRPAWYWGRAEYLMWWVKDAPLPVPIVTAGDPNVGFDPNAVNTVNIAGAIGQPGTTVLLGGGDISSRMFSGLRLTLGGWADDERFLGVDVSGFALERRVSSFFASSDATGTPALYFPIFSGIAGAERAVPIADPLRQFSGSVSVESSLRLWGVESNGILTLYRAPCVEWTALAGSRYADLRERLFTYNTTRDLLFDNVTNLADIFDTRNQFYGSQIGSRLFLQADHYTLDVTGKLALGVTHQIVDVMGAIAQVGPNPLVPPGLGTFPGGLYAQPSNIGRRTANQFTILPSLEIKLGYAFDQRTRAFVGYDVMYWSRVVRPGNQIDRNVNLSQNAVLDPNGAGVLVGPAQPAPLFNRSDFWAQGVTFGVEFLF